MQLRSVHAGFSLVEIMLALALGAILSVSVLQVYLSVKSTYNSQAINARVQEDLRFADYILTQNIRAAGYAGCRKLGELQFTNSLGQSGFDFSVANSLRGYDSAHLPSYLVGHVVPNSDVIIIQKADVDTTNILADVQQNTTSIKVEHNPATEYNTILLISDCCCADLFIAKNWFGNMVRSKQPITHSYKKNTAEISRFEEIAYFIGDTKRLDPAGQHIYGLYEMINGGNARELVEGIKSMQISYGFATRGGGGAVSRYYKASEIHDQQLWGQVVSVMITLRQQTKARIAAGLPWNIYIKLRER